MSFTSTVTDGPLFAALPIAALAGLVSFLSPCVLPLVPGYLSFVTGLTGADLEQERKGRVLLGASLFVLGFSAVFVSEGAVFGSFGGTLQTHQALIDRVLGGVTIVLGLAFLGLVPGLQREVRILSSLDHPNVVKVVGKRLDGASYWYAMPLYTKSLRDEVPSLSGRERRVHAIKEARSWLTNHRMTHKRSDKCEKEHARICVLMSEPLAKAESEVGRFAENKS